MDNIAQNGRGHRWLASFLLHGAWAVPFMLFLCSHLPEVYPVEFKASPVRFTLLVFGVSVGGMGWVVERVSRALGTWLDRHRGVLSMRDLRVELVKMAALYVVPLPLFGLVQVWLVSHALQRFAQSHHALFVFCCYEGYGVLVFVVALLLLRFSGRWGAVPPAASRRPFSAGETRR